MSKMALSVSGTIVAGFALVVGLASQPTRAQQSAPAAAVTLDADDVGGVVTGPKGPEAGVWVIAETTDLPTKLAKVVVTDDRGRYLLPDLPKANYTVWVRGYGLVDSAKVRTTPGQTLNLTATLAPDPHAAAQYYPGGYWFSLIQIPAKSEFPGTGPTGNGIAPGIGSQAEWLRNLKSGGCLACHQIGNKATREIPAALGVFPDPAAAWQRRLQSGQAGGQMSGSLNQFGSQRVLAMFADWTGRVAKGEVPPVAPPRPQGIERNLVITMWDWADPKSYLHDVVSTDRRKPTVNANGPVYGSLELSSDYLPTLDPKTNTSGQVKLTVRDENTPRHAIDDAGRLAVLGRGADLDEQEQRAQRDDR